MDRCDRFLTSDVEGRLKSTILTTKREMVDVQTSLNIELFPDMEIVGRSQVALGNRGN
jgi:hypothetical protein